MFAKPARVLTARLLRALLLPALLLLALSSCSKRDNWSLQTSFDVPSWTSSPGVTGVSANLNGRWERIDDPNSPSEVIIDGNALQKVGRNPMNRYDLLRAFGMATTTPLQTWVNHFGGEQGVLAIAWDRSARGGSFVQYGIRAVVDSSGELWLAFTKNQRGDPSATLSEESWVWRCRRLP
jgi:hypothetical protein